MIDNKKFILPGKFTTNSVVRGGILDPTLNSSLRQKRNSQQPIQANFDINIRGQGVTTTLNDQFTNYRNFNNIIYRKKSVPQNINFINENSHRL